ncbi:sensor histidine kinase [Wenjunlia tyrosinilytica]
MPEHHPPRPRPRRPDPRRSHPRRRSLAGQLFAMQVVVVAAVVAGCAVLAYFNAHTQVREAARKQVVATAAAIAAAPTVRKAVQEPDPSRTLQPYAEKVRHESGVAFVTIMAPDGTRYTHPDPSRIGEHFLGHTRRALQGETFTETYTGTLGPSVRVVTPVFNDSGRVSALVSAGITVDAISGQVRKQVLPMIGVAAAALILCGLGTYFVNARLRRHTHGMGAGELSRMYDYHQATLHAVREGLLLLDGRRRVGLCNDGGRELLGLPEDVEGSEVAALGLPASLTAALLSDEPRVDEVHLTDQRVVVVNTSPIATESGGTVVTLRDHTDLQALTGELDSVRGFTEALRSQAHEAANRLHAVVSLIELGRADEAVEFATAELELAQALTDQVVAAVAEPVLAALLLGKAAQANERGVELSITADSEIDDGVIPSGLGSRDLVTILGNLIDNAVDAAIEGAGRRGSRPKVTVTARAAGGELLIRVADNGRGVDPAAAREVFRRGWSTKTGATGTGTVAATRESPADAAASADAPGTQPYGRGLGLALVEQAARRHGGSVDIGRDEGAVFTVRLPLDRVEVAG